MPVPLAAKGMYNALLFRNPARVPRGNVVPRSPHGSRPEAIIAFGLGA
jgi:hypothetical protein